MKKSAWLLLLFVLSIAVVAGCSQPSAPAPTASPTPSVAAPSPTPAGTPDLYAPAPPVSMAPSGSGH
jgi:PBP1b-binding outer membrane lipoprotein LpoB